MIHIYTGSGKGKTTAATGLAVRAAGSGMRVYFVQFLKNGSSSEIGMMEKISINTVYSEKCGKFVSMMSEPEKEEIKALQNDMLKKAIALVEEGFADMLVLDEFFAAYNSGLIDRKISDVLLKMGGQAEIVLTGRNAPEKYAEAADYLSEIKAVKHPYEKGISARKGIEY